MLVNPPTLLHFWHTQHQEQYYNPICLSWILSILRPFFIADISYSLNQYYRLSMITSVVKLVRYYFIGCRLICSVSTQIFTAPGNQWDTFHSAQNDLRWNFTVVQVVGTIIQWSETFRNFYLLLLKKKIQKTSGTTSRIKKKITVTVFTYVMNHSLYLTINLRAKWATSSFQKQVDILKMLINKQTLMDV